MKIGLIKKVTILTLLTVSIAGCYDYLDDNYDDHGRSNVPGRRNASLDRAISWYEEHKQGEETMLKFATGEEQLFYTEPSWKYRLETVKGNIYTLEVDLTDRIALDFVTDENAAEYESTGDFRYKHSVTRLIIQSNEETGHRIGFLMTIIPSPSFTKQFYRRMNRNTYLNRDPDFDGLIVYHNLDGTFSNGWKYVKGEIVTSLIECTACENMISYQAIPASYKVAPLPITRNGGESIDGGELGEVVIIGHTGDDSGGGYGGGYGDGGYSGGGDGGYSGGGSGSDGGSNPPSPPTVTLRASKNTITLMDQYGLSLTASSGTITNAIFKIGKSSGTQYTLQSGANTTCNMQSKKPGIWQIKATVTLSSGVSLQSNAINIEVQYPDVNKIKSNSTVSSNMSSVWTQTKNAASASGRHEKGFFIYANTTNFAYECGTTVTGPNVVCSGTATISFGSPTESKPASPVEGGKYLVATFHTHTPLTFCDTAKIRQVGASSADNSSSTPGIIYDYIGELIPDHYVGIKGKHNIDAASKLYTFGPVKKNTPN